MHLVIEWLPRTLDVCAWPVLGLQAEDVGLEPSCPGGVQRGDDKHREGNILFFCRARFKEM
jgi:hypothetical protein